MTAKNTPAHTPAHTPGPWKFGKELSSKSHEWLISMDACDRGQGIAIAETRPCIGNESENARLMAAAPDLLDALKFAVEKYGKPGGPWNVPSDPGGWLDRARAAIAKATGGAA